MKPTELYHGDTILRDGKELHVAGIERIRPSRDTYKKPGAERYVLSFSGNGFTSSISVWSDEDIPNAEWPESQVLD